MPAAQRRSLLLITLLGLYIALQFAWWGVLLVHKEVLLDEVVNGQVPTPQNVNVQRTTWMILGEGIVFLSLIAFTLWLLYRGLKRELSVARLQRNFLLAAGHELRTPIASLQLQLQTMARMGISEVERSQLQERALDDVRRLGGLAEKVLLATRLEESGVPLQPSAQQLHVVVERICERAHGTYAKNHPFQLDLREVDSRIDPEAFQSVVENLLENAAKYSPSGSTINVDLGIVRGDVLLRVSDHGPGVPVSDRAAIFDKFFRGGNEETRSAKGTGLGLYIVKRLMKAMGGSVYVEARAGGGSIFAAAFPQNR